MKTVNLFLLCLIFFCHPLAATDFYVDANGNDHSGNGSKEKPWRTIGYAAKKIPAYQNHRIKISAGIFFQHEPIKIPPQVNVEGAGVDLTIIKASPSFYYNPPDPGFEPGRFLLQLVSPQKTKGQQSISGFTVDGSDKQLHGGIYVQFRNGVVIENIKVQYTNFCGIWIVDIENSTLRKVSLLNCSWGSTDWCSGALQFANIDRVEFDQLTIDEGRGYGIKTLGQDKNHIVRHLKIHDSRITVTPKGLWQDGKAPNIAIEIWASSLPDSEIFNSYLDNHISLVNNNNDYASNEHTFRIHHNVIDLQMRAKGEGYGIELTMDDVEIDHNIFKGGLTGIVNWGPQKANWNIHHNVFFGLDNPYPTAVINAQNGNFKDVEIYNNTIELSGKATINFLACSNGGTSDNIRIFNNLIINSNKQYNHYPNRFIMLEKGASIRNLQIKNNLLHNLPIGEIEGDVRNNIFEHPRITGNGPRPYPYYLPGPESPLIDAGIKNDIPYKGFAPDIGAFEVE